LDKSRAAHPCTVQNLIHVSLAESPQKLKKIAFSGLFEQKFTTGSYGVKIGHAWCSQKAWKNLIHGCQKFKKFKKFLSLEATQTTNLVSRNFRG
jgi:hypothetical protein